MPGEFKERMTNPPNFPEKETRNPRKTKTNRFFSLLMCPLLSCAPLCKNTPKPQKVQKAKITSKAHGRRASCSFDSNQTDTTITFDYSGGRIKLKLDIPEGVTVSKPIKTFCQDERSVVVTREHVIRALGYAEVAKGREMLGVLSDGSFYPQNVLLLNISPLGKIVGASASDNILIVSNARGNRYMIDVDNPVKPAKLLPSHLRNL